MSTDLERFNVSFIKEFEMRKLIVTTDGPVVGMTGREALLVENDASEEEINEVAFGMAVDHLDSYGYDYDPDADIYGDEADENVVNEVDFFVEDYDPEVHDMLRGGGGSFEDDFASLS